LPTKNTPSLILRLTADGYIFGFIDRLAHGTIPLF
jgi:hypothetical protein